jgi:hypothetical protein
LKKHDVLEEGCWYGLPVCHCYLVEHFPWFHRRIPLGKGGIIQDLECIVDAIVKAVEDCTSDILLQLPIIFCMLEDCIDGCLFFPDRWLAGLGMLAALAH